MDQTNAALFMYWIYFLLLCDRSTKGKLTETWRSRDPRVVRASSAWRPSPEVGPTSTRQEMALWRQWAPSQLLTPPASRISTTVPAAAPTDWPSIRSRSVRQHLSIFKYFARWALTHSPFALKVCVSSRCLTSVMSVCHSHLCHVW